MPDQPVPALSFGSVAAAYERGRPSYPDQAVGWLVGEEPGIVLELGAGTGKLTEALVALGHDVLATDPDPAMLEVLTRRLPDVRVAESGAEAIPLPDRCVDAVVSAQAFHWFDHGAALPEIARVLRPQGRLALVWNERDERIPWVRRLGAIIGDGSELRDPGGVLLESGLFADLEGASYPFWQHVNGELLRDLVLSRASVATLDEAGRASKLAEVAAFYEGFGRGHDGMELPYQSRCFRATVVHPPRVIADDDATAESLLIDFS